MRKPLLTALLVLGALFSFGAAVPGTAHAASGCSNVGSADGATSWRQNLGTIYTTSCANTNAGRGTISFISYNTDKGSLSYHWTSSVIQVAEAIPGYVPIQTQSCSLGDLPTSRSVPGFGGFTWPVVSTDSCSGTFRNLKANTVYNVYTTLNADVQDDGRGAISARASGYQIRTTF